MHITRTYLQQKSPAEIRPGRVPADPGEIVQVDEPSPEFNRFLYTAVGGDWHWTDRLSWTWQQWCEWLSQPGLETWVCGVRGTPTGYLQIVGRPEPGRTEVQIVFFGLLPAFIGGGIGGHLLTIGLQKAWSLSDRVPGFPPVRRVWLRTSSLDGPHALPNYEARGMRVYHVEEVSKHVEHQPPGPWPGANRPRFGGAV